ncbi:hypothetical protein SAMN04487917_10426 [Arthrobacter sp. yr096]|uniref:hypothetical protein n=1 Tax=unclassified Arthrobacter TaxID=235627 RepID=UPI0008986681|nr:MULTISPECIES: hypothetical protein [unclassified Arthrobacter]SDX04554.1 hypothetical protein SAMN04487912_106350 [Arthrobacter sp. cf158]SEJ14739.1 hypothetical protein SAMN04487917_10426 [Arthrobacter sp. yr096]
MAGHLELVETPDGGFRILVLDSGDALMGLSKRYASLDEAIEGVAAMRDVAGTGLLRTGSAERYALLVMEEPVNDPAPAPQGVRSQAKVVGHGS